MKNTKIIELEAQIENLENDLISIESLKDEIVQFCNSNRTCDHSEVYPKISEFLTKTKQEIETKTSKIQFEILKLTRNTEIENKSISSIIFNALDYYASMSTNDDKREFIQDIIKVSYGSKKD